MVSCWNMYINGFYPDGIGIAFENKLGSQKVPVLGGHHLLCYATCSFCLLDIKSISTADGIGPLLTFGWL
jgi:hypothetical protein